MPRFAMSSLAAAARGMDRSTAGGLLSLVGLAVVYLLALGADAAWPVFWVVGVAFGAICQRSRFCFVAGFRDLFLMRQGRMLRGIIAGLAVATAGFAMVMATIVPNPGSGVLPSDAHILPLGIATVLGGLLFGYGMVIAGGCVSGSLYRMGEGYIGSWVAIGGVLIGLYALNRTWNWWWDNQISGDIIAWIPTSFTYTWAIVLTLALLALAFAAVSWWERRGFTAMSVAIPISSAAPERSVPDTTLAAVARKVFRAEWTPLIGGIALAAVNILLFIRYRPLGVVGELSRWVSDLADSVGAGVGELNGINDLPGCVPRFVEGTWFTDAFMLNAGIIAGAFTAALLAREFRLRIPRSPRRYLQSLAGGVVMGYGAGLGLGCTIGAFFSAIPSLALNGWVYALALAVGAYAGTAFIRRFP
ncbi:MAG: YeeE/YedE family protein [Chloroflexi bacterium]|nr:YeeE/YedE family protein [Chloroflexota bacterium]